MFSNSLDKLGSNMPGKYTITLDHNAPLVQCTRHKVPIHTKGKIDTQLKEITVKGIITPQVEPTPLVSSLIYSFKLNRTLSVCLDPKDLNRTIISKQPQSIHTRRDHIWVSRLNYIL